MDETQAAFLKELLQDFLVEAGEHREVIVEGLLALEKSAAGSGAKESIERIFREAHSLKGAARAVGLADVETLCQAMEEALDGLKKGKDELAPRLLDALHQATNLLESLLTSASASASASVSAGGKTSGSAAVVPMVKVLAAARSRAASPGASPRAPLPPAAVSPLEEAAALPAAPGTLAAPPLPASPPPAAGSETVRVSTARLAELLRRAEELIQAKSETAEEVVEARGLRSRLAALRKGDGRAPAAGDGDDAELRAERDHELRLAEDSAARLTRRLEQHHRSLSRLVDDLLAGAKKTLLVPFSTLLAVVPKIVRDLASDQGKEIDSSVSGGEIEIDRRILEELKDPLVHIVRNSVDHGLERPEAREEAGKPRRGTLAVSVSRTDGATVTLRLVDDGQGIDPAKVKAEAVKQGILTAEGAGRLSDAEAAPLIFRSGLSTAAFVTDLSGRGLGLAIVAEKVARLGGAVSVESRKGEGTAFTLTLPVTLATFRGILVRTGEQLFLVPTTAIVRAGRARPDDVRTVEGKPTVVSAGQPVAVVPLGEVLGVPSRREGTEDERRAARRASPYLVVEGAEGVVAFLVDEVLGEREGLVKGLGSQLHKVPNIAGATLLGNGRVVPILDVPDLLRSAASARAAPEPGATGESARQRTRVLIAEDSVTARSLLRNILESAGYDVKTAVDGLDALGQLREHDFDLLVSDVEMPRVDGFELTERIRQDRRLAELPVVLVTALASAEDRRHGLDVGANAYIVKGSFEQDSLLDAIRRLS